LIEHTPSLITVHQETQVRGPQPLAQVMPPKRHSAQEARTAEEAKRYRKAIDEMAEEFLCPITQELPVDPDTAEDGRVYERSAIEAWLHRPGQVKSPVTNVPMGRNLLPAVQVRNTIKNMLQTGAISGSKAEAWNKRIKEEAELVEWRRKAGEGHAISMRLLGFAYSDWTHGLEKDAAQAFSWFKRAADLDDPIALAVVGRAYCDGIERGVERDVARGLLYLGQAVGEGNEWACYYLGFLYETGPNGLKQDDAEASKWYSKMASRSIRNCREAARKDAQEHLAAHPAG
jgi:hypothetical protein